MNKILIVSPHADDETLGCGGTILKHKKNKDKVIWLIVTKINKKGNYSENQIKLRKNEIIEVKKEYGIDKVYELNYIPSSLTYNHLGQLISNFQEIIEFEKPDQLYIPHKFDIHSDHRVVCNAINPFTKTFRYPFIKKIIAYETLSETNFILNSNEQFVPNLWIDISNFIDIKIKISKIYKSEFFKHPFPRSEDSLKSLAIYRGSQINVKFAESFMILKQLL